MNFFKNLNKKITKFNLIINLPNPLNQIVILKKHAFFCLKYVFIYFAMSFFIITWGDGLVVKALKCGSKGYGFKPYFEHSSLKKNH
jgi:hypothetical protein